MLRSAAAGIVAVVVIAGGVLVASNLKTSLSARRQAARAAHTATRTPHTIDSAAGSRATEVASVGANTTPPPAPTDPGHSTPIAVVTSTAHTTPPLAPIVPSGESPISDGVTAVRTDSEVVVSFDSPLIRTRRAAKFESFVRATLPAIYGRGADSALAHVPDGALANQGDLISDLPTHGMRIPAGQAWEIRLYPEVRNGQDGPLIVRYRVSVVSTGA